MTIKLKFFALLHDLAGVRETTLELPEGVSVADASIEIARRYPPLEKHLPRIAYAVNQEYQPHATILMDGDELALIPPVSGG